MRLSALAAAAPARRRPVPVAPACIALACVVMALAVLLPAAPAAARITDRDLSCADWLRAGARSTSEYSAAVQARIRSFCAANPKMKAVDAEMTMTGD